MNEFDFTDAKIHKSLPGFTGLLDFRAVELLVGIFYRDLMDYWITWKKHGI